MFEEDFERCFICQNPCKGLYCSSECRIQDKGSTPSPAMRPSQGPIRVTSQIPASLSPLVRPSKTSSPQIHRSRTHSQTSSSSSTNSSPLLSPQGVPMTFDPVYHQSRKESFNLPPPAFSMPNSLGFSGSVPVKIPPLAPRPVPSPSSQTPTLPIGGSVETLRFGRKSGLVNSVTSPRALPTCACGKPLGHRRPTPTDLKQDVDLSISEDEEPPLRDRTPSDPSVGPIAPAPRLPAKARSGHATPHDHQPEPIKAGSFLSRSRSDPIPPSPNGHRRVTSGHGQIAPLTRDGDYPARRASHAHATPDHPPYFEPTYNAAGGGAPSSLKPAMLSSTPSHPPPPSTLSPRRGRSRERQDYQLDPSTDISSLLNHPPEREHPPSRSRPRNDRRRSDEEREKRSREHGRATDNRVTNENEGISQIIPSWSRRPSNEKQILGDGEGVVPNTRTSPLGNNKESPIREAANGLRTSAPNSGEQDRKKAEEQLGQIFGIAAQRWKSGY